MSSNKEQTQCTRKELRREKEVLLLKKKEERCYVSVYTEQDLIVAVLVIKPPRLFILPPTKERVKTPRLHLR